ncbi:Annexin A9, partial [Chelonia mydas]
KGADHGAILDVLTNRTSAQRQQTTRVFQALTKQDLLKSMEAALSGDLERVIVGLLKPPAQYDAHELRAALTAWGHSSPLGGQWGARGLSALLPTLRMAASSSEGPARETTNTGGKYPEEI